VFNLGHGILPKTPIESVAALVDEVRAYSTARLKKGVAP
jgi:uroporphyrinogen-III decarboxylase